MKKTREVHLSNERGSIRAELLENTVRIFDVPKAVRLYQENPETDFVMGMSQDIFWTGNTIHSENEIKNYHCMITDWDTPVILIDDKETECFVEIPAHVVDTITQYNTNRAKNLRDMKRLANRIKKEAKK